MSDCKSLSCHTLIIFEPESERAYLHIETENVILALTAAKDPLIQIYESAKFFMRLRSYKTESNIYVKY